MIAEALPSPDPQRAPRGNRLIAIAGGLVVAVVHCLTLPRSAWEGDEILFMKGVQVFDPVHHRPHPPGYPLLIGLGKLSSALFHDPFVSLLALSVLTTAVTFVALADAFSHLAQRADPKSAQRIALIGATLFSFSPAMLIYGPAALSDAPAVMFLALALAAAARLRQSPSILPAIGLGLAVAGAIGCRPQLALAALPLLAVALWQAPTWRQRGVAVGIFGAACLAWFLPLSAATGGLAGLRALLQKQSALVSAHDATETRAGAAAGHAALRFLAHPWGQRWTSLPILGLAIFGTWRLVRTRAFGAAPLAALFGVELALGLWVLHPDDAVRYAIPSLLGVAFAAATGSEALAGRLRRPAAAWCVALLAPAAFLVYVQPLRAARASSESPPVEAVHWLERSVPSDAAILVDKELAPHASYYLPRFDVIPADGAGWVEHCGAMNAARRAIYLLGDGESTWASAETFRWPPSDAYGKLTRGHFRVVSVSSIGESQLYTALADVWSFEPSVLEPKWRWLGPEAAIRLQLRGTPATRFRATFGLPHNSPRALASVTVLVDGAARAAINVPRDTQRAIDFAIPAGARSVDLSFQSREWFVPQALGLGTDARRLSVQLLSLECLPVDDAAAAPQ